LQHVSDNRKNLDREKKKTWTNNTKTTTKL